MIMETHDDQTRKKGDLHMKRRAVVSIILATSLIAASASTGCSKEEQRKQREEVKIDENSPWYTLEKKEVADLYDGEDATVIKQYLGGNDDIRCFFVVPYYNLSYEEMEAGAKTEDDYFVTYDGNGDLINSLDIYEALVDGDVIGKDAQYLNITGASVSDSISFDYMAFDADYETLSGHVQIDPKTGKILSHNKYASGADEEMGFFITKQYDLEGLGRIDTGLTDNGGESTLGIVLYGEDGASEPFYVNDIFPGADVFGAYRPLITDDGNALIKLRCYGGEELWLKADFKAGKISKADTDMSFLKGEDLDNTGYCKGVGNVFMTNEGIKKIDLNAKKTELIFSFDDCNINRNDIDSFKLLSYTPEKIVILLDEMTTDYDGMMIYEEYILTLTKAQKNPNAGKTVLIAASLGEADPAVADAICEFNESSADYFIRYTDKYNVTSYGTVKDKTTAVMLDSSLEPEERGMFTDEMEPDLTEFYLDAESDLSDQLIVDILAGEGPDIIFDGYGYSCLNREDCLLDISDLADGMSGKIFTNITDAAKRDGKLYQIPLSFTLDGIVTDRESVKSGTIGFTFDSYAKFVDEECNGKDPLNMSQLGYITLIAEENYADLISDGKINVGRDVFKKPAAYAADHLPEEVSGWGDSDKNYYAEVSCLSDAFMMNLHSRNILLGLPSSNGKGPCASCACSVGIISDTSSPEGCKEFIKVLMSKNCQTGFSRDAFPINVEAYDELAQKAIASNNRMYDMYSEDMSESQLAERGFSKTTDKDSETFKKTISSCTRIRSYDAPVLVIIREEIQAYLKGDKAFKDVADIINNRAQTYLDER